MATCNRCHSEIKWKSENGKWTPLNLDGIAHRKTCGQLGKPVDKSKHREKSSGVIVGANYTGDGCACGLPPWELCQPDCIHGIGNR